MSDDGFSWSATGRENAEAFKRFLKEPSPYKTKCNVPDCWGDTVHVVRVWDVTSGVMGTKGLCERHYQDLAG